MSLDAQSRAVAALREAAGGRTKLARIAGVSVSNAQAWEKDGTIPGGAPIARLYAWRPDLTETLLRAIEQKATSAARAEAEARRPAGRQ